MTFGAFCTRRFHDAIGCTIYDLPITEDGCPPRFPAFLLGADRIFLIKFFSRNQLTGRDKLRDGRSGVFSKCWSHEAEKQKKQYESVHDKRVSMENKFLLTREATALRHENQ